VDPSAFGFRMTDMVSQKKRDPMALQPQYDKNLPMVLFYSRRRISIFTFFPKKILERDSSLRCRMTNKGKLTKILEQPHFPIHFLS
jgi:hypothetical protein